MPASTESMNIINIGGVRWSSCVLHYKFDPSIQDAVGRVTTFLSTKEYVGAAEVHAQLLCCLTENSRMIPPFP